MTAKRELLDWDDLYGDSALPPKNGSAVVAARAPASPPASMSKGDESGTQRSWDTSQRASQNLSRSDTPPVGGSPVLGGEGPVRHRPFTTGKARTLAQPHDRYGRPVESRGPNYGTLLCFSDEQRRDAQQRERRLNRPRSPPRTKPNYTIPTRDSRVERLAQPRRHEDPQEDSLGASRGSHSPPNRSTDSAVYNRLAQPKRPPAVYVPPESSGPLQPRPRARSAQTRPDPAFDRLAQPKLARERVERVEERVAPYRSRSKRVYGGTTLIEHSPVLPARSGVPAGHPGSAPGWTNVQRPRPTPAPTADPASFRIPQPCRECQRGRQQQPVKPIVVRSEPLKPPERPATPGTPEMPTPPLEVRTKRFQPDDDTPLWPPQEGDAAAEKPTPPPVVVAVRRSATQPPPAIHATRRTAPPEPVAAARKKQGPVVPPLNTAATNCSDGHAQAPTPLSDSNNALGQRVSVSSPGEKSGKKAKAKTPRGKAKPDKARGRSRGKK